MTSDDAEGRAPHPPDASSDAEPDDLLRRIAGTPEGLSEGLAIVERRLQLGAGAVIDRRYRLERLLGEGGMGTVWAAAHTITGERVALKFLKPRWDPEARARRRFLREARAASTVKHPNVVEIFDVLELDDETPIIVMDLLEGETLGQRLIREGRLTLETTAALLLPVARAMEAAHELGIIHRDLKPDNIFLAGVEGCTVVKVLDFGIAKLLESAPSESDGVTSTGVLVGTPAYMALEQALGLRDLDARVDVWALGAILYECLSGERPVKAPNVGQVVLELTGSGVRPLAELVRELPADFTAMVAGMLVPDRAARTGAMRDVIAVLERHALPTEAGRRAPPSTASAASKGTMRLRLLWAVALAGLCTVALTALLASPRASPPAPAVERRAAAQSVGEPPSTPASLVALAETSTTEAHVAPPPAAPALEPPAVPVPPVRAAPAASALRLRSRSPSAGQRFDGGLILKVPF